ncbi:MAG: DUF2520 domain-containing protein [Deltaproteobacteria bacterium]|nr:DUF2520 domain-containing protein [Deltaproteobacteria bacterium]
MRQVPNSPQSKRYGIIGDGAVARHFSHYLSLSGIPHLNWSRREFDRLEEKYFSETDAVLVLIKDGAIEPFIAAHPFLLKKPLVHFSGSLVTGLAAGMHPLMSFGKELYEKQTYASIPFICDAGSEKFQDIFPDLQNPFYEISAALKPLYHSLCVMSGNFTVLLWRKFFKELESKLGLPRTAALPYLGQIAENLRTRPDGAFTGPLQRKDTRTIENNLAALKHDPYLGVYKSFLEATHDERS